jgi:hypothetical protein
MGSRMFDVARAMVRASFPRSLSKIEIRERLCERLYGNEVDVAAFVENLRRSFEGAPDRLNASGAGEVSEQRLKERGQ